MPDELASGEAAGNEAVETVEPDQSRMGRLSRMDALPPQALNQETNRMREFRKERALAALERIRNGSYGRCLACSHKIAPARLEFGPPAPQSRYLFHSSTSASIF